MAIRYPPLIQPRKPIVFQQMVANIDLAPTIYDVAGLASPLMDGSSLVPLLRNQTTRWRKELLLEGWPDAPGGAFACSPPFTAVRTSRYVYSETYANTGTGAIRECTFSKPDTPELYDLKIDPFQIQNVALDPRYDRVRKKLKTRLDQYGYVQFPHKKRNWAHRFVFGGFCLPMLPVRLEAEALERSNSMKVFAICFFLLVLSIGTAMAGKPGGDIPITQEISDVNTISGNPYYIQSDGLGP